MSRYGDYVLDDLYSMIFDFLEEHTITDLMGIVSDAIESKEREYLENGRQNYKDIRNPR